MTQTLLTLSIALFAVEARAAQVLYELDSEIREKTAQILREKNVDYRAKAAEKLKAKGEHFDRARLEVCGLLCNDDTYKFNSSDFDDQMKPSHSADKSKKIKDKVLGALPLLNYFPDKKEMLAAMRGEMSDRAKATVAPFKNMEINEIVAHSWGSELIYAAILNGEMRPPKKLIVAGVPDDDRAKWDMLAARTGTEVHWARADNDAAAIDKGVKFAKETAGKIDFKAKWDAVCAGAAKKRICHAHGRKSKPVIHEHVGSFAGVLAHDRKEYYDILKKRDVIKGTIQQLRALETKKIDSEAVKVERDLLTAAHREARELVEQARELARREREKREEEARAAAARKKFEEAYAESLRQRALENEAQELLRRSRRLPSEPPVSAYFPPPPFSRAFPQLREFAVAACRAPEEVPIDMFLMPYYDHSYRAFDDDLTAKLSSGLGDCPRRLFHRLIELIRASDWRQTDRRWIRSTVAAYSAAPGNSGGNFFPPSNGSGGGATVAPPPPPAHDAAGKALEQLQEIERRRRWGLRPVM